MQINKNTYLNDKQKKETKALIAFYMRLKHANTQTNFISDK